MPSPPPHWSSLAWARRQLRVGTEGQSVTRAPINKAATAAEFAALFKACLLYTSRAHETGAYL
eukprot:3373309-Pyramimonas_sp.AAC.1